MNEHPIKLVIVDDHRLFNDGLREMLKSQEDMLVVAQVYDSREAEGVVGRLRPEVVLVDFNMPHINGIELTQLLMSTRPELKVLILSMYHEDMYIQKFKKAGCKGYLFKTSSVDDVASAIRRVIDGGTVFPTTVKKDVHSDDVFIKKQKLSTREMEVVKLVKEGLTTKAIAERLGISFYTAETHRKNIKLKMGIEGEAAFLKFVHDTDLE